MRAIVFFIYLSFHLLGGGHFLHADTNHNNSNHISQYNFTNKLRVKLISQDFGGLVIEDADLDLDDEHASGDNTKFGVSDKFIFKKYSLLDRWYLTFSDQFSFDAPSECLKNFQPFSGYSNPIYIQQRVLRI
jgi:hypothetical protein